MSIKKATEIFLDVIEERDALRAEVERLKTELAQAKQSYQKLLELNQRNCEDAARIHATSNAVMELIRIMLVRETP